MSTPAQVPAGARPAGVAVAPRALQDVRDAVRAYVRDASQRPTAKAVLTAVHQGAYGTAGGRPPVSGKENLLPEIDLNGPPGATVASRPRRAADGRQIREVVGIAENDEAAVQRAAEALGRDEPDPAVVKAFGAQAGPEATVDNREARLNVQTSQNGLSTDSPTRQAPERGGAGAEKTGSRIPSATPKPPDRSL